jgi:hypothetical protein
MTHISILVHLGLVHDSDNIGNSPNVYGTSFVGDDFFMLADFPPQAHHGRS